MGKEIRSIRYFDGLFMKAEEFIQEQNYHTRMRRLHNRYLHSSGIVWGLEILKSKKPGANPADVTVTQGMALNKVEEDGEEVSKEIILTDDTDISLLSHGAGKMVYIYITYLKEPAPKNSEDSKKIHWLEEGKPVSVLVSDRNNINEDENVLLGKVSLINANGTVTVDKIYYEESGISLRKYAGFSGKSLQAEKIILAIDGVTSGFASIEGKQTGINNGIQVNSPITGFSGELSIGDKLGVGGNVQLSDNKSLVLGITNKISLHNNSAAPELWLEATGQLSSALVIGTAFDPDKQVKVRYTPGAVGASAGELRIGQDVKLAGAFTHGITTLYTNGMERLRIDATGNVIIGTGHLKILGLDTFLDFGADLRQMLNLGNGYGIGVQTWTQYYRSTGNFAWYVGGAHNDAELNPGGGTVAMVLKRVSGNVGIGTTTPPQKLSISGQESSAHGMGAAIGISNVAPGGANWYLRAGATGTSTPESGFSIADDIGYRLVIDKSGNVGIGTNTPGDKLDVEGSIRVNNNTIWLRGGTDIYHGIGWYGAGKLFATANIDGPAVFGCAGGALGTACGGEKIALYWNAAGNVGIGTTTPPQKLSVSGQESSAHGMGAAIGISNKAPGGANWYLRAGATGTSTPAGGFSIADDIGYRLVVDKSGNVGIGTNSPGEKLDVAGDIAISGKHAFRGSDTWLRLNQDGAFPSGVHTPGVFAPMSLNVGGAGNWGNPGTGNVWIVGNVGIGTTSPQVKVHVVGNRIRLQKGNGHSLDLRADGSAFDIESLNEDLYINNISNTSVRIKNFVNISSREMKENFSELSGKEAFETLENLNPLRFQYKGDTRGELHLGFIAEDVSRNVATADRKGISPMAIIAVLTRVVKEQQKMILILQESTGFAK